jgi:hypothetical protein
MTQYYKLRDRSQAVQWTDVEPYAVILRQKNPLVATAFDKFQQHCNSGSLWSFFTEDILKMDNKLLTPRINLITFAMKPREQLIDVRCCSANNAELSTMLGMTFLYMLQINHLTQCSI